MGRNPGAGEGNRTLVVSLEGFCSTIELHPPRSILPTLCCSRLLRSIRPAACGRRSPDSTGGEGWIRTNVGARPTDLQSAPFSRSGTSPRNPRLSTISRVWANKTGVSAAKQEAGRPATDAYFLPAASSFSRSAFDSSSRAGCRHPESNGGPTAYKAVALPD